MSKAEKRALEKYPLMADDDKEGLEALKYIGMECECTSMYNEAQEAKQAYFIKGYHQAEKDLELTLEDIKIILDIKNDIIRECDSNKELVIETYPKGEDYYGEILKRFKERKEMEELKEYFPLEVLNNEEIEQCQKLSKNGYTSVVKYLRNVHPEIGLKEAKIYYDLYFNKKL